MSQVVWDRGVSVPAHGLWLDPQTIRDRAFVSHAHADHARRHRHALLTGATLALLPETRRPRAHTVVDLGEPVIVGGAHVTLHDAGHMLGSAQVLVEHHGHRILYTGDLKLRRGRSRTNTPIPPADVLVIESTYGLPGFRFPDPDWVVEELAIWCRRLLDANVVPVLLAHAAGKCQEVMLALEPYGFRFALEERCLPFAAAYESAGVRLPAYVPLDDHAAGLVVIAPPAGKEAIRRLPRHRTTLVSGWAQDRSFWRKVGADCAFPYSDHCDFDELVEVVELSGARQVYTVHGFAAELATSLRRRGVRASPLASNEQLQLAI
jgi:Cft2 family RNA processing exonuclease